MKPPLSIVIAIVFLGCGNDRSRTTFKEEQSPADTPRPVGYPGAKPELGDAQPVYERDIFQSPSGSTIVLTVTPPWYNETLGPWKQLSEQTRKDLWTKRLAYEATMTQAVRPANAPGENADRAAAGEKVLHQIVARYNLDPYYRRADTFGPRMVIWLPEAAWADLSPADKDALRAYMMNRYANWGIGVGRQKGREVLFDRLVEEH